MDGLLTEIKACTVCKSALGFDPRPVMAAHPESRILIIGQAPGRRVHESGIPWNDPSGKNLRSWLNLSEDEFYNAENIAIVPMGFCYPGTGKSGDLPPRPECAPLWHSRLLDQLTKVRLTLLIGQYAQREYLGLRKGISLTETVKNYRDHLPATLPLPHPSPRNRIWMRKNSWFETEVLPELKVLVNKALER